VPVDRVNFGALASASGPLLAVTITANPAANNEFTTTVPVREVWLLQSVSVQLVETVQTPWPSLTITPPAPNNAIVFQSLAGTVAMQASLTAQITWAQGVPTLGGAADTVRTGTLPGELYLGPGTVIASVTAGIGANCDYGSAAIAYLKYTA
jgi:hypothetical protein